MNNSLTQVSLSDLPDELLITIGVMLCKTDPKSVLNLACVNLDMDEMSLRRFLNERLFISSGD